ncbi:MAG: hypothetical protein WBP30_01175 [Ferruginibacter sp.]
MPENKPYQILAPNKSTQGKITRGTNKEVVLTISELPQIIFY